MPKIRLAPTTVLVAIPLVPVSLRVPVTIAEGPDIVTYVVSSTPACPYTWGPNASNVYGFWGDAGVTNVGNQGHPVDENTNEHAVLVQNLYRLENNRFEQIGMSWIKHDDWCCAPCPTPPAMLPYGACQDIYGTAENATGPFGPRSSINPFTGAFASCVECGTCADGRFCPGLELISECIGPPPIPDPSESFLGHLQVQGGTGGDLDCSPDPGSYVLESQFLSPVESAWGNQFNNVSYVRVTPKWVSRTHPYSLCECSTTTGCTWWLQSAGYSTEEQPAIRRWQASNSAVVETQIDLPSEGRFILAALATELTGGWYSYEYALYNMNSDRSARAFRVNLPSDLPTDINNVDDIGFHDVHYHSGDPFNGTDWTGARPPETGSVLWESAETYAQEPNANALRWGTLYNFRFEAKRPPVQDCTATVTIELFKPGPPGAPTSLTVASVVPQGTMPACTPLGPPQANPPDPKKNRSLSVIPLQCAGEAAIRIKLIDLQSPVPPNAPSSPAQDFHAWDLGTPADCLSCTAESCPADANSKGGCARWVGPPFTFLERQENPSSGSYRAARLQ